MSNLPVSVGDTHHAIVGQDDLQYSVGRILKIFAHSGGSLRPHFILTGPSGSGKTHTIATLCQDHGIRTLSINAAALTKEGTSGSSVSKALSPLLDIPAGKLCVVIVDEWDKLFVAGNSNSEHTAEHTSGVQNEFLKILEGTKTTVFGDFGRYPEVTTENLLFVFCGAFNGEENITGDRLRAIGVKNEFIGRVPLIFQASKLSLEHMFEILERSPLLDKYLEMFKTQSRVDIIGILKTYIAEQHSVNSLGARLINGMIHYYFIQGSRFSLEGAKKMAFQKMDF